jgi:autoinducer-2 kinase
MREKDRRMKHLLALDAGTGSGRAVIFDQNGKQLATAGREWVHLSEPGVPGSMTFDSDKNWQLIVECIHEAAAQVPGLDVAAVSTTSMREAIVVYDEAGQELWACANVDARAVQEVRDLRLADPELERRAYLRSGQTFALGAAPRLLWLKRHCPELYARAASVAMLSDWVAHRLGARVAVDPSNGGTTGLFNLETRTWDAQIVQECGLRPDLTSAPVLEGGVVIGEISPSAAAETGLHAGTPVVMGGGDAQLGAVGVGVVLPGQTAVLGGTFWQQMVNLDRPLADATGRIRMNFAAVPGLWQAETIVFFPGFAVRWFRDAITPDIKAQALAQGRDPYAALEEMAREVPPGSFGILPIYSDAMDYAHWRHAAPSFLNLSVDPAVASRAAMFRALQENAAIVTLANLRRIADLIGAFPDSVIFASGASKGPLWCQILADVLQVPVTTPVVKEATALGAAISAGVGAGLYASFDAAVQQLVRMERTYTPNPANAGVYQDLYERWSAAYPAQLELANRGITQSLWRAPGE